VQAELATGIDMAIERYLPGGGLLSANVFHRRIRNLIRSVTTLETPPWAGGSPRWVSRPQNIGDAITQGVELEAKFRASDMWAEAPSVDLRANASLFRSRVHSVPGPDNRLDQQPGGTANIGADYKWRGTPLTVGGNLNWNPSYTTRLSEDQFAYQGRKRVVDAYALWLFQPGLQLRLSASNLAPLDYASASTVDTETATTIARSCVNWQLRLEMKL
jgi:outer membrane receptor for ferrienterochelin and colicins